MCEQQFHCLSEIDAKVTIFRVGSKVRTFCMFYSVFHHITHKSLPPITSRGTDRICFQEILKTYQFKPGCYNTLHSVAFLLISKVSSMSTLGFALACYSLNFESLLFCFFCIREGIHSDFLF